MNCFHRQCGIANPSWAEVTHFISFLSVQLKDSEHSVFCSQEVAQDLPGFKTFVVRSMIQMSRDFATRSLNVSEESSQSEDQVIILYLNRVFNYKYVPYVMKV